MFYIILAILIVIISSMLVVVLNNILMYKKDKYKYTKYMIPAICIWFSVKYLIDYLKWPRDAIGTSAVDFSNIVFLSSYIIATISCVTLCILIDKEIILQEKIKKPVKEEKKAMKYFVEEQEKAFEEETIEEELEIKEIINDKKETPKKPKTKKEQASKEKTKPKKTANKKTKAKVTKDAAPKKQTKTKKKSS
jgi:hypothetical protein